MSSGQLVRVNVGCGRTPTAGFLNFDNSPSVRLARYPMFVRLLSLAGLLGEEQMKFIAFARNGSIAWADAIRHIPLPDNSANLIYSSHMLEHFDRLEARQFLAEAKRVLAPGCAIRLVLPDLKIWINQYNLDGDADSFVAKTLLAKARPNSLREKIAAIVSGDRHHLWMYDGASLCKLLTESGFRNARALGPGETTIPDPGDLNLQERAGESVYVEAIK